MSVAVLTFGCRLNAYESEVIRCEATAAGIDNTIVVNTCAVTAEAVRQAKQAIRRVKREGPDVRVVVTGCAAQTEAAAFAAMPEVDRVIGNEEKFDASRYHASARGRSGGLWWKAGTDSSPHSCPCGGHSDC